MTGLKDRRPDKIVRAKCTQSTFFRLWMDFLEPFHHLAVREKDVAAEILNQLFRLREQCADPAVAMQLLWSQPSKSDMRARLGITQAHFQTIISKLRKAHFMRGWQIEERYIPDMSRSEDGLFQMMVLFDWTE